MKSKSRGSIRRRVGCTLVIYSMLAGAVAPAHAVSGTSYTGFVWQLPGVYTAPPDPNVMFTMDDSGSMLSDSIPDIQKEFLAGLPTNDESLAVPNTSDPARLPSMWKNNSSYLSANWYKSSNAQARYLRSSAGNPLYYDPKVTYKPWPKASNDKELNANADPEKVNLHAYDPFNNGRTINLKLRRGTGVADNEAENYWPGTWYVYTGTTPLPGGNPSASSLNAVGNFRKYELKSDTATPSFPRDANRSDCSGAVGDTGCSYQNELQNFANWLQYYHSRALMAKGGVAAAFARQQTNLRVGFGTINSTGTVVRAPVRFADAARTGFYTDLYGVVPSGGTPLRRALFDVGEYFKRTGASSPWKEDANDSSPYTCRRSFHILSTDGFWNGADASTPANANHDTLSGNTPEKPDKTAYKYRDDAPTGGADPLVERFTISPFQDNVATTKTTLADVAAYYWRTDLQPGLDNEVASSTRDPAYWQHLSTYTVGLGVAGTGEVKRKSDGLAAVPAAEPASSPFSSDDFENKPWLATQRMRDLLIATKTALTWTVPSDDNKYTGDDLIHASMVGRGQYFSATNPTDLSNGLATALGEATDQPGDFASIASDAPQLRDGGKVYQAVFSPFRWYGRVYAFRQDPTTGKVNNKPTDDLQQNVDQIWEASNKMPAPDRRNIFTWTGATGGGTTFAWNNLTAGQQVFLNNDPTLLTYLRGDAAREVANGGTFRDRARYTVAGVKGGVLGDIVNGSPVKGPDAGGEYDQLPTTDPARALYATYRSGDVLVNMRSTIFFAANDGMLHAVNSADGVERFAYVPNAVYNVPRSTKAGGAENKLAMLAEPTYPHRFTVDGPPNVSDAYIAGAWRTMLTASNGAGARGVYAMDVTDTVVGSGSAFGTGKLMWEFTEADNADMGFVLSYPHVVKLRNGSWGVIFGNGYDSSNGKAKLFVLDAATGTVLREFTVGTSGDNNNGLGQPNFTLNQREVMAVYAGDLKGNLWKFDLSDRDPARWNVAFGGDPLFTAPSTDGIAQPITVMPEIETHPRGGVIVTFGTGKLFEENDTAQSAANVNLKTQSIYGIWDKPGETQGITAARATALQAQTASSVFTSPTFATTSSNAPDWTTKRGWYLDLTAGGSGERVSLAPQIVRNTLFIVANTPQNIPCENGGLSRVFAIDPVTGAAPQFAVFQTGNVQRNNGVMTQPMFQYTGQSVASGQSATGSLFSRGDASAARKGGFEQRASKPPCEAMMTAAMADTTLSQSLVKLCQKRRISWRQLQ